MTIYESVYLRLEFFKEYNFMEFTWLPTTKELTEEEYKEELLNYLDLALEWKPKRLIMNLTSLFFTTSPTMQEWTEQNIILPVLVIGVTDMAIIMSTEFIAQLATEQILDESEANQHMNQKFFSTKEEAKEWVLSFSDTESE